MSDEGKQKRDQDDVPPWAVYFLVSVLLFVGGLMTGILYERNRVRTDPEYVLVKCQRCNGLGYTSELRK